MIYFFVGYHLLRHGSCKL